jgi:hypothetical protein
MGVTRGSRAREQENSGDANDDCSLGKVVDMWGVFMISCCTCAEHSLMELGQASTGNVQL